MNNIHIQSVFINKKCTPSTQNTLFNSNMGKFVLTGFLQTLLNPNLAAKL